jgi:predicted Ser/Thr protein kinase
MMGKIRFNGTTYTVAEVIRSGLTSVVYKTTAGPVIKRYKRHTPARQIECEVSWLVRLRGTGIAPELLGLDRSARAILMSDCGEPISARNAPHDWEKQITALLDQLSANGCAHNDLSENAILVREGKLRVIDFAFAVETTDNVIASIIESGKKTRFFLDEGTLSYIKFKLSGASQGSEPHCFVLWQPEEHEIVKDAISRRFDIIRTILYTPQIFGKLGQSTETVLSQFYSRRDAVHGAKGRAPFILYFVLDANPRYELRHNASRSAYEMVNVNVFDMKAKLRKGRTAYLHGSSSLQESYDNLEALSLYANDAPKSYWIHWRPSFASLDQFFEYLKTRKGLEYVILRNFGTLLEGRADEKSDIDILVNDFYLFKRTVGAVGFKHKIRTNRLLKRSIPSTGPTREYYRAGPAYEYGGYKVAGLVNIAGKEIAVDIRFVGDRYYCEQWERDLLARSQEVRAIRVPDPENQFYSLLYHALVHKLRLSDRYRRLLREMAPAVGVGAEVVDSDEQLWTCLDKFMIRNRYTYDRPSELALVLSAEARKRMGITTDIDLDNARALAERGQLFEAIDLARGILANKPENRAAQRLLKGANRALRGSGAGSALLKLARATQLSNALPTSMKCSIKGLLLRNAM